MTDDPQTQTSEKAKFKRRKPIGVYLKECAAHLWLGIRALWPLWIGIVALIAVWFVFLNLGHQEVWFFLSNLECQEKTFRLIGMSLQLGGVATVAKGLIDSGKRSKKLNFLEKIALFFKKFPRRSVSIVTGWGRAVAPAHKGSAKGIVLPGPNTPLERRVELLEGITESLFSEVGILEGKLRAQSAELTLKMTEEVTNRKAEHKMLEEKIGELETELEMAVTGNIHIEWLGVFFFIVGIILASASPELAQVCKGMV